MSSIGRQLYNLQILYTNEVDCTWTLVEVALKRVLRRVIWLRGLDDIDLHHN